MAYNPRQESALSCDNPTQADEPSEVSSLTATVTESTPLLQTRLPSDACSETASPSSCSPSPGRSPQEEDETVIIPPTNLPNSRIWLTLGATYVGVFLGALDSSIMATLSGPIASEFQSLSLLSWLATAYLIANATFQPLSGRLTDIIGRGPGLVFSNVMFALGNLLCGIAKGKWGMIVGRVIGGVGGGGLMSISTFLASDLVPLNRRGVVQGVGNIAYGSGSMLGGVFGGWISDSSPWGWRFAFLVQVPVIVASGALVWYLVDVPPRISNRSLLSRIDFGGTFLIVGFLVLLLLGLSAGGNLVPWTDPLVLTTIPMGIVMMLSFVWWESRAKQPVIPVRLLLHRTILTACFTNFTGTMVTMMSLYYMPLYLQVLGHSTTQAGLRLLASSVGVSIGSYGSGVIMNRTGRYVRLGISLLLLTTAALSLASTLDQNSPSWIPFVSMGLLGAGYGGMLTVTMVACIAAVDHSYQAVITSATYAFRSVGGTLGITVASALYQNILKARLWERFGDLPGGPEEIGRIRDDLAELGRLPAGWHEGVIQSFMDAFKGVWYMGLALSIAGLISISLMKQHKLHSNLARQDD